MTRAASASRLLPLALLCSHCATSLVAQCPLDWEHDDVGFGVVGTVHAMAEWDPDGAGPSPAVLVVAGDFFQAGSLRVNNIALWDPQAQTFSSLGTGTDGPIHALLVDGNNNLVIGGGFTRVDQTQASGLARWDGNVWSPYGGAGIAGTVLAIAEDASGNLIVGGQFQSAGSLAVRNVALWNPTTSSWSAMGSGLYGGASRVQALAVMPNGDVIAGGVFLQSGATALNHMASWDGSTWSQNNGSLTSWSETIDLIAMPNGDLLATGDSIFTHTMRLSNGQWSSIVAAAGPPTTIMVTSTGSIVASRSGWSLTLDELVNGIWQPLATLPPGLGSINCILELPGGQPGDLVFGGDAPSSSLMRFENGNLVAEPSFIKGRLLCLEPGNQGELYVGGQFSSIGGLSTFNIAKRSGNTWQPVGFGLPISVRDIVATRSSELYAIGAFSMVNGAPTNGCARFDGTNWQALPGGPAAPQAAIELQDGRILVSGDTMATYDGSNWQTIPGASQAWLLQELPNGDIAAAGWNGTILNQHRLGIWNGTNWTPTPGPMSYVQALSLTPTGELLAQADFAGGSKIGFWTGSAWQPVGGLNGLPIQFVRLHNGDVLANGSLSIPGHGATQLARWDGQTWTAAHSKLELSVPANSGLAIELMTVLADGSPAVSWRLQNSFLPTLRNACSADAADLGSGCPNGGGDNLLTAQAWPLIDATYRATGTGLPTTCFVIDALGYTTTNLALTTVLPTALPGCVLHVDPAVLGGGITTNGIYRSEFRMPSSAGLIGQTFYQQLVPIEIDASGNLGDITATNAMTLTIGAF